MVQFRLEIHRCSLLGDSALLIILLLYLVIRHLCIPSWPLSQREREKEIPVQSAPSLRRCYVHHLSSHPFSPNLVMWQYPLHRALGNVPISRGAVIKGVKDGRDTERLSVQFSSVQSLSRVRLFATPWIAARQASLSIINSRSSPRLMSIESMMSSSHLILCHPLLLLPPIPPSIRVFSNESTLHTRWSKYQSFSFSIIPSKNTQDWYSLEWTGHSWTCWSPSKSKGLSRVFSNTTVQKHQFFGAQISSQSNFHIHTWPLEKP